MQRLYWLVVGVLAFISAHAQANQVSQLGVFPPPISVTYGNTFSSSFSGTVFYDDVYFSIPENTTFSSITSSISLSNLVGISDLQARLYTGNTHVQGSAGSALLHAWGTVVNHSPDVFATTVVLSHHHPLDQGLYTLQLRGTVVGEAGGAYSGVLNVAPVPEPDSFFMLVCGLGIMGMHASRRLNAI